MDPDDLDDLLDDRRASVEARFRELERQQEMERMRGGSSGSPPRKKNSGFDDLSEMKATLDRDEAPEPTEPTSNTLYFLVLCPHCGAKNRTPLHRVRTELPRCGACKGELSFA